jgi:hypothetical protein
MKKLMWIGMCACVLAGCVYGAGKADEAALENRFLKRELAVVDGVLTSRLLENKLAKTMLVPTGGSEFRLRISEGTDTTGTDVELTAADFAVKSLRTTKDGVVAVLENATHGLAVKVSYTLAADEPFARKQLTIRAGKPLTIERIDVEALAFADGWQPYTVKAIYSRGKWSPGLGQPLYTTNSATFWGIEFPAAYNHVEDGALRCGYLWGHEMKSGETYTTYPAVVGVGDDPAFITDAFMDYIDTVRARPLRLQTQYNSWFDFKRHVTRENFKESVETLNNELCTKRGVTPLKAYVIDDGWQDSNAKSDWSDQVWTVNGKFDEDFSSSFKTVGEANSNLGLWMSPGCNFGARGVVPILREKGMGGLKNYMSLANTPYMDMLEQRMVGLTESGVTYFKLDGLFGHLRLRDFDLDGVAHGVPLMPQLGVTNLLSDAEELNDATYDEAKSYYLTVGAERLMQIFEKMAEVNPDVYIVISNGAWLSPWWLMHIDSVWMINAGDAAGGSDRNGELVYRDGVYYEIWETEKTQFPMSALFNHEPKKDKTGESRETFRDYLLMNLSRGTGFVELYLKTEVLSDADWDVLAEGLKWAESAFPVFRRVRMHGGNPRQNEVYGYSAWNSERGYVSIHNPSDEPVDYELELDRAAGVVPGSGPFRTSSPQPEGLSKVKKKYSFGQTLNLRLAPHEIRLIEFKSF